MGQGLMLGILVVSSVCMCLVVISMILLLQGQKKQKKALNEMANSVASMQRQMEMMKKQGKPDDAFLSELKSAVAGAVANQMEYEARQKKPMEKESPKEPEKDLQSTMVIPTIPAEKAGTILCRNCYKPYPVTERKCPFCQTKQNK